MTSPSAVSTVMRHEDAAVLGAFLCAWNICLHTGCLVLMHVEKLISSLLAAIPSPGESSLFSVPRPCLRAGALETHLRVLFPASDDLPLSCCTAVFNFPLSILSCCCRKVHCVPLHDSSPICSWISGHHGRPFRGMRRLGGISSCG